MDNKKITKRDNYETILQILDWMQENNANAEIAYDDLKTFINKEIENLDKKAIAAKARAAKQKEKGDELREEIFNVLSTEDFMSIPDIIKALDNADITAQRVASRLTQLFNLNRIEKSEITIPAATDKGKGRKAVAYRAIG